MSTTAHRNAMNNTLAGFTKKLICLFGVGEQMSDCYNQLLLVLGRAPDFLCDNAEGKWGKEFLGVKCLSPSELHERRNDTAVIITIRNYETVYRQLRSMGITDVFVSCYDRGYNYIQAIKIPDEPPLTARGHELPLCPVKGKWTLVTGSARGVGRRIALEMARLGSNIIAHGRSVSHVTELADACSAFGVQVVPIAAEFSNPAEVEGMLSDLEHMVPPVDIVFNNAGIACRTGFWSSSSQDYLDCFTVNAVVPIRICQALLPQMMRRGFGRIVNISSAIQKRPSEMAYACSKAALDKFVHDLAPSLQGTGVMLSLVNPGWVRTDMSVDAPHAVESVIPGALLGALLDCDVNGRWFGAQDYAGLSLEDAVQRAMFYMF